MSQEFLTIGTTRYGADFSRQVGNDVLFVLLMIFMLWGAVLPAIRAVIRF